MEARKLRKEAKILLTDLAAGKDEENLMQRYKEMTAASFCSYALIKLSMNYFTFCEMEADTEEQTEERSEEAWLVREAIGSLLSGKPEAEEEKVREFRDRITARMKVLTANTDFFEQHEYILNRKEAGLLGEIEPVSCEELADEAFRFVFADQDKMVINTRIQSVVEQLPVRMTRQRFYDIISEAVALYKGGDFTAAKNFVDSVRDAALLDLPEGFDEMYPDLKQVRDLFDAVTYKELDTEEYKHLSRELANVTGSMETYATRDLLLQEIINDILIVQLTAPMAGGEYLDDNYQTSAEVLKKLVDSEEKEASAEQFDQWFLSLEGAQEEAYDTLLTLESSLDSWMDRFSEKEQEAFRTADMLTSTSLFMDISDSGIHVIEEKAEEEKLEKLKEDLFRSFDDVFNGLSKEEKRSRMAKVLSMVPVFFNSKEEIRDYFLYALENCRDDSELTAVSRLIRGMIMDQ